MLLGSLQSASARGQKDYAQVEQEAAAQGADHDEDEDPERRGADGAAAAVAKARRRAAQARAQAADLARQLEAFRNPPEGGLGTILGGYCRVAVKVVAPLLAAGVLYLRVATMGASPARVGGGFDFAGRNWWWCPGPTSMAEAPGALLVDKHLDGDGFFGWWNMPRLRNFTSGLGEAIREGSLRGYDVGPGPGCADMPCDFPPSGLRFSKGTAADVARAMFWATRVPGVIEHVPPAFQGVFWVKGFSSQQTPEVLMSMQYGRWFPEESVYVYSKGTPFAYAYPAGPPPMAFGASWQNQSATNDAAWTSARSAEAHLWRMGPCPPQGYYCRGRETMYANLAYGQLQVAAPFGGNLRDSPAGSILTSANMLELTSFEGSTWARANYYGIGGCNFIDFGGFDLVKVIDQNGEVNEPHWSEFVDFMDMTDAFTFSGWTGDRQMQEWREWYRSATARRTA